MAKRKTKKLRTTDKVALGALATGAGVGIYFLVKEYAKPCEEGKTRCIGYDLYTCIDGKWVLTEEDAEECIVVDGEWFDDNEEMLRQEFSIEILEDGGWFDDDEEMLREEFLVKILEAGYTLTCVVEPSGAGLVEKNPNKSEYYYGEEVKVTAYAWAGTSYVFSGWWVGDDYIGGTNPITFMVTTDTVLIAYFY